MTNNLTKTLFCIFLLLSAFKMTAQVFGGDNVYEFVNLPASARITALGGNLITVLDDDINLAVANPALLNSAMHQQISFSHNFYIAGIGTGHLAYGHYVEKWKTAFHGSMQYINYGTFDQTDIIGNTTGEFKAAEYAFTVGAGRELYERLSVGANLRIITSQFESYNSTGIAGDLAAIYHDTARQFNLTFVLKNIGTQLTTYTGTREPVPFEIQAGLSKRLRHLPFRFSIIYRYLDRWNILYDDPNSQDEIFFFGDNPTATKSNVLDNFARHFVFNGEFLFGQKDNFRLRFGYNHLQRKEMALRNLRSMAGFSMGVGLKINRFRIDFGRSLAHLGAGQTHLTVSTNIREFTRTVSIVDEP
ncbi:MAG: type IX secretion system protein PorQ [Saprospiraceae bacterium]